MGLDIWFKDDIANILRAVDEANLSALAAVSGDAQAFGGGPPALRQAYREGFAAALAAVALALGLALPTQGGGAGTRSARRVRELTRSGTIRLVEAPRR
jgi:hypothetical protein